VASFTHSKLTALQGEVLEAFFQRERGFFLTGGAALVGFHLGHRTTDDLDLFTREELAFERGRHVLADVAAAIGGELQVRQDAPGFKRLVLTRGGEGVVVDIVKDTGPQLHADKLERDNIVIDPADEILANKLTAMRGPRDSRPRPPRSVASKIESRAARRRRAISEIHEASNTAALSVEAGGDLHVAHEQFLRRVDEVTAGLGAEDELAVARCVMRDDAIEARAARVATEEYARKRLAELAAEWTWLMQTEPSTGDAKSRSHCRVGLHALVAIRSRW